MKKKVSKDKKKSIRTVKKVSKKKKSKKIFAIVGISIVIIAVALSIYFLFIRKDSKFLEVPVQEVASKLEDGSNYVLGAATDISFDVNADDGFTSNVVDENGDNIEITITEKDGITKIKAPINGYVEGATYTLTIKNGTFVKEELSKSNVTVFSVKREAKQIAEFKEDVKQINSKNNQVEINDDTYTLKTSDNYNVGDIIIIDNESAYKVESIDNGKYVLTTPQLEEIYSELDYYGSAYLNFENPIYEQEIEEYVAYAAKKSLSSYFVDTVYADNDVKVNAYWDSRINGYVVNIKIEVQANGKVFKKDFLKNHKFTFEYQLILKARAYYDLKLFNNDISITLEVESNPKVGFKNDFMNSFENNLFDNIESGDIESIIKNDYDDIKDDKGSFEKNIVSFHVPTPVAGLYVDIDFKLVLSASLKVNASVGVKNKNTVTIGYKTGRGIYGRTSTSNTITAEAFGELSVRAGGEVDVNLSLLDIVKVGGGVQIGMYGKAGISVKGELSNKGVSSNIDLNTSAGVYLSVLLNADIIGFKKSLTLYDREWELYSHTLPIYKYEPEVVYHTVTLTLWSDCYDACSGELFCKTRKFSVRDGGTLKEVLGFNASFVTRNTYNEREKTRADYDQCVIACWNAYDNDEEIFECTSECKVKYPDIRVFKDIPADYTTNSKIYGNLDLLYPVRCNDPLY